MTKTTLSIGFLLSVVVSSVSYAADCNGNSVDDAIDISTGTSQDYQPNGRPDECEIAGLFAGAPRDSADLVSLGLSGGINGRFYQGLGELSLDMSSTRRLK